MMMPPKVEELLTGLASDNSGTWVNRVVDALKPNRVAFIMCCCGSNNETMGVRAVGSELNRSMLIDGDGCILLTVKLDSLGSCEIFSQDNGNDFDVVAIM